MINTMQAIWEGEAPDRLGHDRCRRCEERIELNEAQAGTEFKQLAASSDGELVNAVERR
jgi:hypothetical protein